jgi:calcineurin-like phosphoesterase family protein
LTVQPERDMVNEYVGQMSEELVDEKTSLWFLGRLTEHINKETLSEQITIFNSIAELVERI